MSKLNPDTVNLKLRITKRQRDALHREAKRRGMTASALLRDQVRSLTGVEDPLLKRVPGGKDRPRKNKT